MREADVDKRLIDQYFKKAEYLIDAYVVENDYWMVFLRKRPGMPEAASRVICSDRSRTSYRISSFSF